MDSRGIDSLWCDDITFCQEDCERMDCQRNKRNIYDRTIPHSFSVEIPQDCLKARKVGKMNVLQKIFGINEESDKNPDGLTWSQFVEKYPECKHIANLCWYAGCYPEELKQELKNLLEGGERDA